MTGSHEVEILLVEDDPNDAELAMRALRKNNLSNNVVHVTNGEQALDFLFARGAYSDRDVQMKPKVVILDLKLPKINGLEVLRAIKGDPRTATIPIVIMTSSKEESDLVESYRLGVNSYIVKPVDFEKFVGAVRDLGMYWLLLNQIPTR